MLGVVVTVPSLFGPAVPFAPRRWPFYYGWWILVVMMIAVAASIPGQTMGMSVFTEALAAATGLSTLQLSLTYGIGTTISGLALPYGGSLVDRIGCRRTVVWASLAMALTLLLFSRVDAVLPVADGSGRVVAAFVATSALFAALRFSGQGMITLSARTMLGRWFQRRRGMAAAVTGVGIGFAFSSAPLLLKLLRDAAGWRGAWVILAVGAGLGMALIGWLFFRDNPEECGLVPDGPQVAGSDAPDPGTTALRECTRAQALATVSFWVVTLLLGIHAAVFTGITFHIEAIGREAGLDGTAAVAVFLPMAVVGMVVGFLVGLACDRWALRPILIIMALLQTGGFAVVSHYGSPIGYWLTVLLLGAAGAFFGPISTIAPPILFGRRHLGAINGAIMTAMVLGSALGPALLASAFALYGSYRPGIYLGALLPLGVLLLIARMPRQGD